jgi:hypothetical protein
MLMEGVRSPLLRQALGWDISSILFHVLGLL